jgi:sugar lactone lactonase YvrE
VVDNDSGFAYIPDSGIFCDPLRGGILVYDAKNKRARRVLDRTMFTSDEPNFVFNVGGRPVLKNSPMRTGADGVALSGDKQTLYWTNLTGNTLWSVSTALLRDPAVSEVVLQSNVKRVACLPSNADGLTADRAGNVYLTALTLDGLLKYNPQRGTLQRFVYHPEMVWPDTLSWGSDGSLYVISNHLNLGLDGDMDFEHPAVPNFRIWRILEVGKSYATQ